MIAALVALGLAAVVFAIVRDRRAAPASDDGVAELVGALGLERVPAVEPTWRTRHGEVTVSLRRVASGDYEIRCRHATPIRLGLGPDGALAKPLRGPEVTTGDASFDADVRVAGDEVDVLLMLDPPTRRLARQAANEGWVAEDGAWSWRVETSDVPRVARVVAEIGVELARRSRVRALPLVQEIVERLRVEAEPGVCARLLALRPPADEDAVRATARVAASALAPHIKADALRRLVEDHPDHHETIERVALLAAAGTNLAAELAVVVAHALRRVPHDDPEGALVTLLDHEDRWVRLSAIESLRLVGTIPRAVPALVRLRDKAFAGEVGERAGEVVATIRARAQVDAGRLAVVDAVEHGGLAVVDERAREEG